jgi:hypothetical protein
MKRIYKRAFETSSDTNCTTYRPFLIPEYMVFKLEKNRSLMLFPVSYKHLIWWIKA